jgi:hypothetical protein
MAQVQVSEITQMETAVHQPESIVPANEEPMPLAKVETKKAWTNDGTWKLFKGKCVLIYRLCAGQYFNLYQIFHPHN